MSVQETKSKRTADFKKDLLWGGIGEAVIRKFVETERPGSTIEDISFERKADIRVSFPDGRVSILKVKFDSYDTGNIFLETVSNDKYSTLGCIEKSQAEYLFYLLPFIKRKERSIIVFPVQGLKDFMATEYFAGLKEYRIKNDGYYTIGRPANIDVLLKYLLEKKYPYKTYDVKKYATDTEIAQWKADCESRKKPDEYVPPPKYVY